MIPESLWEHENLTKQSLLKVDVLHSTVYENLLDILDKTGNFFSFILGLITSSIGKWVYDKMKTNKKKK